MALAILFVLGLGNFALHKAVVESGHPAIAQLAAIPWLKPGRATLAVEFAVLVAAMIAAASGHAGWTWVYAGYSALNGVAGWLILTRRM